MLTMVVPTHNRAHYCAGLIRWFANSGWPYPIVVVDSSGQDQAAAVSAACGAFAEYRHFDPDLRMADKLLIALQSVKTPYVLIAPDDDLTFPNAVETCLAFLQQHADYSAAHGYIANFQAGPDALDIYEVCGFTPTIADVDPLNRLYELIVRYQPFYFSVMRTEILLEALRSAVAMNVIVFRELMVMASVVLRGKVARLPIIYNLRRSEDSLTPLQQKSPFHAFLANPEAFFHLYKNYRDRLTQFIREKIPTGVDKSMVERIIDLVHASYFSREIEIGTINYTAQQLLSNKAPASFYAPGRFVPAISAGDIVHPSRAFARRYIWRKEVVGTDPSGEIAVTPDEIERVERELEQYASPLSGR